MAIYAEKKVDESKFDDRGLEKTRCKKRRTEKNTCRILWKLSREQPFDFCLIKFVKNVASQSYLSRINQVFLYDSRCKIYAASAHTKAYVLARTRIVHGRP